VVAVIDNVARKGWATGRCQSTRSKGAGRCPKVWVTSRQSWSWAWPDPGAAHASIPSPAHVEHGPRGEIGWSLYNVTPTGITDKFF
jgi:hypothetical protein